MEADEEDRERKTRKIFFSFFCWFFTFTFAHTSCGFYLLCDEVATVEFVISRFLPLQSRRSWENTLRSSGVVCSFVREAAYKILIRGAPTISPNFCSGSSKFCLAWILILMFSQTFHLFFPQGQMRSPLIPVGYFHHKISYISWVWTHTLCTSPLFYRLPPQG